MAEQIVVEYPLVQSATYALPNKHYIPVDMRYAGIDNLTPCVISFISFIFSSFSVLPLARFLSISLSHLPLLLLNGLRSTVYGLRARALPHR